MIEPGTRAYKKAYEPFSFYNDFLDMLKEVGDTEEVLGDLSAYQISQAFSEVARYFERRSAEQKRDMRFQEVGQWVVHEGTWMWVDSSTLLKFINLEF